MAEFDQQQLAELIGLDKIPVKGAIPAAWWVTLDETQIGNYDRWREDYDDHRNKIEAFAHNIGLTTKQAMMSSWGGRSVLTGFDPPQGMRLWSSHPEHVPLPEGWRIDSKSGRLVPKRKTKADRESQANRDFAALKVIPDVQSYVTGMPTEIYLEDRGFGGTIYKINYRRGHRCVVAFCGADPDRSPDKNEIDTEVWHRQRLSVLIALREAVDERSGLSVGREIGDN